MNASDVQGTLREMWETRPARPRDGRQVAGVAAAIARRYGIDPVLVRIGFVVAGFYGVGVALYIAGWLLLPDGTGSDDEQAAVRTGPPQPIVLIGLAILGMISFGSLFNGGGLAIVPAIAALGLLFLLHRSRGGLTAAAPHAPAAAGAAEAPTAATATAGVSMTKEPQAPVQSAAGTPDPVTAHFGTPPTWDPLGAAPFAWDLPEPSQPAPPPLPRRKTWPVTAFTLAMALLAGGVTTLVLLMAGNLTAATVPILLGVVLAVLGIGLLAGSFVHAGRGIIPVAVLVAMLTWAVNAAPVESWPAGGFGDIEASPDSITELEPVYSLTGGDIELDLTRLDLSNVEAGPVRTAVTIGAGDVDIRVPRDADVTFTGSVGLGQLTFDNEEVHGPGSELGLTDLGADGVRGGQMLEITVNSNMGDVEVSRG